MYLISYSMWIGGMEQICIKIVASHSQSSKNSVCRKMGILCLHDTKNHDLACCYWLIAHNPENRNNLIPNHPKLIPNHIGIISCWRCGWAFHQTPETTQYLVIPAANEFREREHRMHRPFFIVFFLAVYSCTTPNISSSSTHTAAAISSSKCTAPSCYCPRQLQAQPAPPSSVRCGLVGT